MSDGLEGMSVGIVVTAMISWVITLESCSMERYANEVIADCELSLPRTNNCKLTAIPKEVE